MRTLLAMTFAVLLSLTACGTDDGTDSEAGDDATSTTEEAPSETSESDDEVESADADSTAASDEAGGTADASADQNEGDDATAPDETTAAADPDFDTGPFCAAMSELDAALDLQPPLLDPSRSPDEVEELVVDVETRFDTVVDAAPADLQPDWTVVSDAFKDMTEVIRDADFDVSQVDQATILEMGDNDEAFAAGERLPSEQEYCGT